MTHSVPDPGLLALGVDGVMKGATSSYEKRLGDMGGVYRDDAAYRSAVADKGAAASHAVSHTLTRTVPNSSGSVIAFMGLVSRGRSQAAGTARSRSFIDCFTLRAAVSTTASARA